MALGVLRHSLELTLKPIHKNVYRFISVTSYMMTSKFINVDPQIY